MNRFIKVLELVSWEYIYIFIFDMYLYIRLDFPGGSMVKNLPANTGDTRGVGSISGSGRSPGGGNGNLL